MDEPTGKPEGTVIFRIRVSLVGTDPEIWRLLEVYSQVSLPQVHQAIQIAFGWRESHLHAFTSGDGQRWFEERSFDDGLDGRDEREATLADVLTEQSGPLLYEYDFGDSWEHLIELIETVAAGPGTAAAQLISGERRGPLEDSGGAGGYAELVATLSDPTSKEYATTLAWVDGTLGPWHAGFDPEELDIERVNRALARHFNAGHTAYLGWSNDLTALANRMFAGLRTEFADYVDGARLDQPVLIEAAVAEQMVKPYSWLLQRVGADGIKLTAAGWLPPAVVTDAMRDLDWGSRWIGKFNREDMTMPVLNLRQSATRLGLLRKYKGRLLLGTAARGLVEDPVRLWWYIARKWLTAKRSRVEQDGAILLAVELAVGSHPTREDMARSIAYGLDALGWVDATDHGSISDDHVRSLITDDLDMLGDLGVLQGASLFQTAVVTPSGRDFARAALAGKAND